MWFAQKLTAKFEDRVAADDETFARGFDDTFRFELRQMKRNIGGGPLNRHGLDGLCFVDIGSDHGGFQANVRENLLSRGRGRREIQRGHDYTSLRTNVAMVSM